ncbi:DUF4365 domain-containing protein [Sphingopyxis sp. PAMC25046]|nr:DUF4365 domain-containing protein [Sphingopyxis sp. PAMC25046]
MLPQSPRNYQTERLGVNAVAVAVARLGLIWRETPTGDVGIDGQIEYVDAAGHATGRLLSVQVKSGISYFANETEDAFLFYFDAKHRRYIEQHPLPVLLILHNPDTDISYWADVRQQLRGERAGAAVRLPKHSIFQTATAPTLFETDGIDGSGFIDDLNEVCATMIATRSANASFPVSHFDLFAHGLTNIARSIYYGMDVPLMVAEANLARTDYEFGFGVGEDEHLFLFGFVRFLIAQNLARIDFGDCLIDWIDREKQPHFVAPLTARGRDLVRHIRDQELALVENGALPDIGTTMVVREAFFEMVPNSFSTRLPRIQEFQAAMVQQAGAAR